MALTPIAVLFPISAPVTGNEPVFRGSTGSGVFLFFFGGCTADAGLSRGGVVLPSPTTGTVVVSVGMGLPALAARRILRIAGPDHTSAAPTPIAEPPRTKARRVRPASGSRPEDVRSSPGSGALVGGGAPSCGAPAGPSAFATATSFPAADSLLSSFARARFDSVPSRSVTY
jgi:hypothetical protein